MFEVLAFVYENYYAEDACPEPAHLQRKLNAVGFEDDEISEALEWLSGLSNAARFARPSLANTPTVLPRTWLRLPCPGSTRVYSAQEQHHIGQPCLSYMRYLDCAGILPAHIREVTMDRAMAISGVPLTVGDLKLIILMVFWTLGQEPEALVLDELCDDNTDRCLH